MEELTTWDGTVHSIIFQNAENGYTVLRLLTEEGEVVTVVGCIPCVAPGEHLTVSGVWETHSQHGEQLRAVEMERSLPEKISALQKKYGVDPGKINLEITETNFEHISEIMFENVNELIRMGYSFALDDYGTGYSSIQRVMHLPLKLIKIDKSMLEEVSTANGRMILDYTMRMMQSIGKLLVVEGAETADEVEILRSMNCDYIQGFYFSQPLPEEEFIRFLEKQNQNS